MSLSFPFPVTVLKYSKLAGDLGLGGRLNNNPLAWDKLYLNNDGSLKIYALPETREEWLARASQDFYPRHAKIIHDAIDGRFQRICSYGVGCGWLEYNLKLLDPKLSLQVSDFGEQTVQRLRKVFYEADKIENFDLLKSSWGGEGKSALHLFYRLDPELSDPDWKTVFCQMWEGGIENVLLIHWGKLTWKNCMQNFIKAVLAKVNKTYIPSGYLRNRLALMGLFSKYYEVSQVFSLDGRQAYFLKRKKVNS